MQKRPSSPPSSHDRRPSADVLNANRMAMQRRWESFYRKQAQRIRREALRAWHVETRALRRDREAMAEEVKAAKRAAEKAMKAAAAAAVAEGSSRQLAADKQKRGATAERMPDKPERTTAAGEAAVHKPKPISENEQGLSRTPSKTKIWERIETPAESPAVNPLPWESAAPKLNNSKLEPTGTQKFLNSPPTLGGGSGGGTTSQPKSKHRPPPATLSNVSREEAEEPKGVFCGLFRRRKKGYSSKKKHPRFLRWLMTSNVT